MSEAKILIVEDEPLIAMMLEDFIESLGHHAVGTVDSVEEGLDAVAAGGFDMVILDVNLRDNQASWPIADALDDADRCFALATGGSVDAPPSRHVDRPYLEKPFTLSSVEQAIEVCLEG